MFWIAWITRIQENRCFGLHGYERKMLGLDMAVRMNLIIFDKDDFKLE